MANKELDGIIHALVVYFTGPDGPANQYALSLKKGGSARNDFFCISERLGISGFVSAERAQEVMPRKLGLAPAVNAVMAYR